MWFKRSAWIGLNKINIITCTVRKKRKQHILLQVVTFSSFSFHLYLCLGTLLHGNWVTGSHHFYKPTIIKQTKEQKHFDQRSEQTLVPAVKNHSTKPCLGSEVVPQSMRFFDTRLLIYCCTWMDYELGDGVHCPYPILY
jgi:hypothetical protein